MDGKNSINGKDILGNFFEGIIRDGFKQSKGQFFTHVNIVRFMLWGLQTDKLAIKRIKEDRELPYMIDPSAGSGTFLIEYMRFITENMKHRLHPGRYRIRSIRIGSILITGKTNGHRLISMAQKSTLTSERLQK